MDLKKILIVLCFSLFIVGFSSNNAEAAGRKDASASDIKATYSGIALYTFRLSLYYTETSSEYSSKARKATYRNSEIEIDRKIPHMSTVYSHSKIYNGSTLVGTTNEFTRYYPDGIHPTGIQYFNKQNSQSYIVQLKTGKSRNTSGASLSCSDYSPCLFPISATISY